METLKRKRTRIRSALTRFMNQLESDEYKSDVLLLKVVLEKNDILFDRFNDIQSEIELLSVENSDENAREDEYHKKFETDYYKAIAKARKIIKDVPNVNMHDINQGQIGQPTSAGGIFLLRLNIPKFTGNYSDWIKFCDTFDSLMIVIQH